MVTELDRVRHSAQDRRDWIGEQSDRIAQQIMQRLLKDEQEAREIAGDMIGFMEDKTMAALIRHALRGETQALQHLLVRNMFKSVERVAEHRAIQCAEELERSG